MKKVTRNYLEINSIKDLLEAQNIPNNYFLKLVKSDDFQLNKFFYKQIGKKYNWVDRLEWSDQNWIDYISNKNLETFILKDGENLIGYFETLYHRELKEVEIAFFGILEDYFGKKLGGYMLSEAIKKFFCNGAKRVWVHTCSLDHKYALDNYLARGMTIFKKEKININ